MAIHFDGSKFGINNGTTDVIEMSRNLYPREATSSFRSRNLVSSRIGHEILESTPRTTRSTPNPPADASPGDATAHGTAPVPAS